MISKCCNIEYCGKVKLGTVRVFNLSTAIEYVFNNITSVDALVKAHIENVLEQEASSEKVNSSDYKDQLIYGNHSIGLGDLAVCCRVHRECAK